MSIIFDRLTMTNLEQIYLHRNKCITCTQCPFDRPGIVLRAEHNRNCDAIKIRQKKKRKHQNPINRWIGVVKLKMIIKRTVCERKFLWAQIRYGNYWKIRTLL